MLCNTAHHATHQAKQRVHTVAEASFCVMLGHIKAVLHLDAKENGNNGQARKAARYRLVIEQGKCCCAGYKLTLLTLDGRTESHQPCHLLLSSTCPFATDDSAWPHVRMSFFNLACISLCRFQADSADSGWPHGGSAALQSGG